MIGPGWLPRPISRLRRRTLAYTRLRRRSQSRPKPRARPTEPMHHETVIFDHGPVEFPIATVVPRDPGSRARVLAGDLARWLAAKWRWFRPRTVPFVVAALGATLVIASAEYLSHAHGSLVQRSVGAPAGGAVAKDQAPDRELPHNTPSALSSGIVPGP